MKNTDDTSEGLTLRDFTGFITEIQNQPKWRAEATKELSYRDGNQLTTDRMVALEKRGIPVVCDNLLLNGIQAVLGAEVKNRTDWRVIPDTTGKDDQDIADAFAVKLSQSERRSRADRCISDAYESQISIGVGWVEVSKTNNLFDYPYQCRAVNFFDMYYDWFAVDPMLKDARWLIRKKWVSKQEAISKYPDHEHIINNAFIGWLDSGLQLDDNINSNLGRSLDIQKSWQIGRDEWLNIDNKEIRLYEVWYRKFETVNCIKLKNGKIVEYNKKNPEHINAIINGAQIQESPTSRVFVSVWAGCHKLSDDESPYTHGHFPYVPFWGYKEQKTGIPYGKIRNAKSLQDLVNIYHSKIVWSLSAVRTIRTVGAVVGDDEDFRNEASGLDADILLDAEEMKQQGARFEIVPNTSLTQWHMQALSEAKSAIHNILGVSQEYQGVQSGASSNAQEVTRIQQSSQALANLDDNKNESRTHLGELLLAMLVQDSNNDEEVFIAGDVIRDDRRVVLNQRTVDEDGDYGVEYLINDVNNALLKVVLSEVPTNQSYKLQQYTSLAEVFKSAPTHYQTVLMPYMMNFSDLGENKQDIIKAIKEADNQPNPEMQKFEKELELKNKELELKSRELAIKERVADQTIENMIADKVKVLVDAQFAAYGVGQQVMMSPIVAPVADSVLENAGYQAPTPVGNYPDLNIPAQPQQPIQAMPIATNTSPQFPPRPQGDEAPMPQEVQPQEQMMPSAEQGIETSNPLD